MSVVTKLNFNILRDFIRLYLAIYFVSEVINTGNKDIIAMGLVPEKFDTNGPPGWEEESVAYHADDGG